MKKHHSLFAVLLLALLASCSRAAVPLLSSLPASGSFEHRNIGSLVADNQQFVALNGVTDNNGKFKNTYQNYFRVKVAAKNLLFPFAHTYSDWNDSETQTHFDKPATYRAAVSLNRGEWHQLTWNGQKSKECAVRDVIWNDPLNIEVKTGDTLILRTEISVPAGGKWGHGAQARQGDENPNWTEGGTNSDADVLLSDKADFKPQNGLFTHTAQGVFGTPIEKLDFHSAIILGDSISPYVLDAALNIGDKSPVAYFGQPAESAVRFWKGGQARQKLLRGYDVMLYQYGVNDLRNKDKFESMQEAALGTWNKFKQSGGKHLIVFTSTPLSRSTDGWKTLENQTPDFVPEERIKWNNWLRSLKDADVGMKLTVLDTAALFENAPNDSLWKPLDGGAAATDDGCHPNGAGYEHIKKELAPKIREAMLMDVK